MDMDKLAAVHEQILTQKMPTRLIYIKAVQKSIKDSVNWDVLIVQAIRSIEDIDVTINMIGKRMREWYEWSNPENSRALESHEAVAKSIIESTELKTTFGAKLTDAQTQAIHVIAKQIISLEETRELTKEYVEKEMETHAPKFTEIAGGLVGAKLLSHAGTVRHLATLPSSTIQLLGAEKALFRHLKTGARPPKYGILFQHALVSKAKHSAKGKTARQIANKLAIAIKQDYFTSPEVVVKAKAKTVDTTEATEKPAKKVKSEPKVKTETKPKATKKATKKTTTKTTKKVTKKKVAKE